MVVVTVFVLGFLATRAEPALRVMGRTVEALSDGRFTTSMLIYTVRYNVMNVCVRACVCVCACVRACVRACVEYSARRFKPEIKMSR